MSTHSLLHPMTEKHTLAVVVVHPRAFRQPKQPGSDRRGLRELADVVSLHLWGCISACLSAEESEHLIRHVDRLLTALDDRKGQAS